MNFLENLRQKRVLGILRGVEFDELETVASACRASGLGFIEITMNTPAAAEKITKLCRLANGAFQVGAGTVLTRAHFRQAVDAGASFVVSPVLVDEVAQAAVEEQIPFLPGALTPQEIYNCYAAGASLVKVFPVQCFGPGYLREVRGPFQDIPLLACGGIRPDNIAEYLQSGADAVSVGASTFKREWLRENNAAELSATLAKLVALATA